MAPSHSLILLLQDVGELQASSDDGGCCFFFSRRRHHVEVVTKNMMQIKELLEPLFKRSRLHDVSMVGSAPLNLQCF